MLICPGLVEMPGNALCDQIGWSVASAHPLALCPGALDRLAFGPICVDIALALSEPVQPAVDISSKRQ